MIYRFIDKHIKKKKKKKKLNKYSKHQVPNIYYRVLPSPFLLD